MLKKHIKNLTKNNKMSTSQQQKHAKKMARNGKTFLYHPEISDSHNPSKGSIHDWCDKHDCPGHLSPVRKTKV